MSKLNKLTPQEEQVILHKGTQAPFSGEYDDHTKSGIYQCRRCDAPLYYSKDKFHSGCGWPSFDDEIDGAVKRVADTDGRRIEIVCASCGGHLGHLFEGEQLTAKNTRHCVNSISMKFKDSSNFKKAYFAGGCFWGVEYWFDKIQGVIEARSGYMGGHTLNPTYQDICNKDTGHLEVVEVLYESNIVTFKDLTRLFFNTHNPSQKNGQGPDIGSQYLSAIFYNDKQELEIVKELISELEAKKIEVATKLIEASKHKFYVAEDYHQNYYKKKNQIPYCHSMIERLK